MGWTPPDGTMRQSGGVKHDLREASVSEIIIIGLDSAKSSFMFTERMRGRLAFPALAQPSTAVGAMFHHAWSSQSIQCTSWLLR
jgi:hypothetical protein